MGFLSVTHLVCCVSARHSSLPFHHSTLSCNFAEFCLIKVCLCVNKQGVVWAFVCVARVLERPCAGDVTLPALPWWLFLALAACPLALTWVSGARGHLVRHFPPPPSCEAPTPHHIYYFYFYFTLFLCLCCLTTESWPCLHLYGVFIHSFFPAD